MSSLNKVFLIGRLGQDPEKRVTPNGAAVLNLSLATSEKWTDKQGNRQEKTEWHRVTFWNKQADVIEQYSKKGDLLYVEGSLETKEYEKDGQKRYSTEINGRQFQFLGSSGQGQQGGQPAPPAQGYGGQTADQGNGQSVQPDDIPF